MFVSNKSAFESISRDSRDCFVLFISKLSRIQLKFFKQLRPPYGYNDFGWWQFPSKILFVSLFKKNNLNMCFQFSICLDYLCPYFKISSLPKHIKNIITSVIHIKKQNVEGILFKNYCLQLVNYAIFNDIIKDLQKYVGCDEPMRPKRNMWGILTCQTNACKSPRFSGLLTLVFNKNSH